MFSLPQSCPIAQLSRKLKGEWVDGEGGRQTSYSESGRKKGDGSDCKVLELPASQQREERGDETSIQCATTLEEESLLITKA